MISHSAGVAPMRPAWYRAATMRMTDSDTRLVMHAREGGR